MEARAMDEPHDRDTGDHAAANDDVPRTMDLGEERARDVVRHEQGREGDDDQVVEEQDPAGDEAPEVVEGDADERRGTARFADRRRPLRIGERDDQEEGADSEQHGRGETERVQRDDPQGEVDRGGDLAVRDREERRGVQDPLKTRQLARHARRLSPRAEQIEPAEAECHEQRPEHVAEIPAPNRGHRHECDPDPDEHECERRNTVAIGVHAAFLPAATITRQGACLSTKSTVSPKSARPGRSARGAPMTMISELRLAASSTIARPALRARTIRSVTSTPYSSAIAAAASSAAYAFSSSSSRSASSGSSSGTSTTLTAAIEARRSAASRAAKSTASSEVRPGLTGTRMLRYSSAMAGPIGIGARIVSVREARTTRRRK